MTRALGLRDGLLLLLLALVGVAMLWPVVHSKDAPTEDAAMLLRYSQHVAAGQGITWNVGERPVEGATDFLYMMAVGGVTRATHGDAVLASRELQFMCLLALPLIAFACSRFTLGASRWVAFAIALYLVAMPGRLFLASCFGAPFLMLIVSLAWWMGLAFISGRWKAGAAASLLFSVLAILIGLTRPEGNVLAVLLLAAIVSLLGWRRSRMLVATFAAVFIVVGGAYFAWRLHYFGYLLPNPFYVKGGGHLHPEGLGNAAENVVKLLWPTVPVMLLAVRNERSLRLLRALLIPLVGYTAVWVLLSNENNALFRFQIPLLPVTLLFLPLLLQGLPQELGLQWRELGWGAQRGLAAAAVFYVLAASYVFSRTFAPLTAHNSGEEFAEHLSMYAGKGYSMATTEAGTFPYFSQWTAVDLLGLNDATIAHEGLSEAYLDRYKPEVILYHLYPGGSDSGWMHRDRAAIVARDDRDMTVAHAYAVHHGYELAAAYSSDACSLHYFWVRPGTADTDAIVNYLRNTPYYFLDNGVLSTDFRNGARPECHLPVLQ
jgi:hypothetical protein